MTRDSNDSSSAGPRGEPPVRVVIAVGGDYWDQCAAYPQLVPAMEQDQLVVGPMPEAGLLRAITGPAEVSGLRIESALIETVLADARTASGEQGAWVLPQLSQAMMATWVNRDSERLTAEGYDRAGRVARAVEVSAEAVYNGLADNQKTIARDTFRQLTAVGHDRRPVRRTASRADLRAGHPKSQWSAVDAVLEAFFAVRRGNAKQALLAAKRVNAETDDDLQDLYVLALAYDLGKDGARAEAIRRRIRDAKTYLMKPLIVHEMAKDADTDRQRGGRVAQ